MKYIKKAMLYQIKHPVKTWLIITIIMFFILGLAGEWNIVSAMLAASFLSLPSLPARREYRAREARKSELDYLAKRIAYEQGRKQEFED